MSVIHIPPLYKARSDKIKSATHRQALVYPSLTPSPSVLAGDKAELCAVLKSALGTGGHELEGNRVEVQGDHSVGRRCKLDPGLKAPPGFQKFNKKRNLLFQLEPLVVSELCARHYNSGKIKDLLSSTRRSKACRALSRPSRSRRLRRRRMRRSGRATRKRPRPRQGLSGIECHLSLS